ncbi:MAG: glycoside hydrolase family 5 protein [Clostridium sp.]|nr:glycoside hydrolase family 5 protein [Bacteroides sp.]MCM1198734.1 glycoside hydrolase family 5 protein [Clostridium sp.]
MKILNFAIAAMLLLFSCGRAEVIPQVDRLHVDGTALVNESGEPVQLRGVSLGWHNLWPRFYNEGAVKTLSRDWKADVVRAAIGVELDGGYCDFPEEAIAAAQTVADAAIREGKYVIIDWHSHSLRLNEAKEFFTIMANRYKGVPNVIYELFNEPVEDSWADLKAYHIGLIELIRSIDPSEPVILAGCPHWDQDIHLAADDPIVGYANVMYTLHFYAGTHKEYLRERGDYALAKGLPVFVSECGGMSADGDGALDVESFNEWVSWMDGRGLSYAMWSLSDKLETCSMLTPFVTSEGPWPDEYIKPWGRLVRQTLN